MKTMTAVAVLALSAGSALAQVQLDHLKSIDLSSTSNNANPEFIGSNPSAVAWDGTDAWVGGNNSSGVTANTGIVRISNVLGAHSIGASFGTFSTANTRGITSLAVKGGDLAASLDNGTGSGDSVRLFNKSTGALTWRIGAAGAGNDTSRRGNGVAFDPGFNGAGTNQGVGYLAIGSGRRHLLSVSPGTYINGQNAGAIINTTVGATTWRDLDFQTNAIGGNIGDMFMRESNRVARATRTGDNSVTSPTTVIVTPGTIAAGVDQQNIAFVPSTAYGNFLIYNDRGVATPGQSFSSVVKVVTTSGAALTLSFPNGDFNPATGNGAYDFSFDAATQTLAVTDFANRQLHIFAVPTPGALGLLGVAGLVAARRRR